MIMAIITTTMSTGVIVAIFALAIAYVLGSVALQRKLASPMKQQEIQARLNKLNDEMKEMLKNKEPNEKIMEKQKELMPHMKDSMMLSVKPMLVILPLFMIMIYVVLPTVFGKFSAQTFNLIIPLHYKGLFLAVVLILGLASTAYLFFHDRKRARALGIIPEKKKRVEQAI